MSKDAKLTTAQRKKLKSSTFCGPGRSFPVPDCAHYTAALRLLNRAKVSESTRAKIRSCVNRKGKSMGCTSKSNDNEAEQLIESESFDETHEVLEFIEMIESDTAFQYREEQKLKIVDKIIELRKDKYNIETIRDDYLQRTFDSLLDTLLDELD